jgi:hypothetical protein
VSCSAEQGGKERKKGGKEGRREGRKGGIHFVAYKTVGL